MRKVYLNVGPGSLYYETFHYMMSKNLYIMADLHYMMIKHLYIYGRLTLYADTTSLYYVCFSLYYGLLSLYASS